MPSNSALHKVADTLISFACDETPFKFFEEENKERIKAQAATLTSPDNAAGRYKVAAGQLWEREDHNAWMTKAKSRASIYE
jgi:hypothetical protein